MRRQRPAVARCWRKAGEENSYEAHHFQRCLRRAARRAGSRADRCGRSRQPHPHHPDRGTDPVAQIAGHQVALVRGYSGSMQQAIQALESDVVNSRSSYHEMTAVLDKVAAGQLLARRQDVAANQLLSHALEQLLARGKRSRDTEAAAMNMRLGGMTFGRAAGASLLRGASDDLRTWRQP